jgi:hypothetical protein
MPGQLVGPEWRLAQIRGSPPPLARIKIGKMNGRAGPAAPATD